jgi:hypothetical protein
VSLSSADPFDELRRDAIFNDRNSQEAVIVQHLACASPRLSDGSVGLPCPLRLSLLHAVPQSLRSSMLGSTFLVAPLRNDHGVCGPVVFL